MRSIILAAASVWLMAAAAAAPVAPFDPTKPPPDMRLAPAPKLVKSSTFSGAGATCEEAESRVDVQYFTNLVKTEFKTNQIKVTHRCEKTKDWYIAYYTFTAE